MTRRRVMISSTARDLPEHREQVRLACERAGFAPHDMMEHLTALNADAIDASLKMVAAADVYVGIFAYRYGYVPDGHDISITEMEYNRAVELDKPRLIFFIHEDHPVTGRDFETGAGAPKLQTLKDRIGKARVAAFFRSPEDLRAHVIEALTTFSKELETEGPIDAAKKTAAQLHRKTSIPAPPDPYVAHPYTLLQLRDLVGRQAELNALTDWVAKPGSPAFDARIFCFVAIGGMGKSALTWKWFNQIAPNEMKPLAGRLWWSFYESDATFENFLNRALCYVSRESEEEVRALPWQEREARLLQHLNDKPYLFVLDGLERILFVYNRMDASSLADDEYDQKTANWVAGAAGLPPSAAQSFTGEHRLRQTTDPRAGAFLRKLTRVVQSRVLATTRLYPYALQLPTRDPYPGSAAYFLRGLSDDDAIAFWRGLNVTGPRSELLPIFKSIQNHPLLIQVFAGVVANYRKAPRDFEQWKADHPQFDPTSLLMDQPRARILAFALDGLSTKAREALHTIVGFRMPASYASLEALLVGPNKACNSAQNLDHALTELEDRGLIGWDREANRYDAHPIVRSVLWEIIGIEDRRAVFLALEAHFEPMPVPNEKEVETLADLTPAIERYHTLVGLERYEDAFIVFQHYLDAASYFRLAAHRERIAWLEKLFPNSVASPPRLTHELNQSYTLHVLALSFKYSGEPRRAASLLERAWDINKRYCDVKWLSTFEELGETLFEMGAIRNADSVARQSLLMAREAKDKFHEAVGEGFLSRVLCITGDPALSLLALKRAQKFFTQQGDPQWECVITSDFVELLLRVGDSVNASSVADHTSKLATARKYERDVIQAALLQGRAALALCEFMRAEDRLHEAVIRARAVNQVELEIPALITLAELELERGNPVEARARLSDVWEAAERGPYPLQQADAYNVLADIALAEGNKPASIDAATKAYKTAWCDGPPYAYHWGLQKAKAHLAALGAPEPDMPPFDESKFEPLPDVEINPKDEYWIDPDKLD